MSSLSRSLKRRNRTNNGFTLIEMVLVIVLIGILISAAIFGYVGYERMTNNRMAQQNYATLMTAKIAWCSQNQGSGTPTLALLSPFINSGQNMTATDFNLSGATPTGTLVTGPRACNTAGETLIYTGQLFGSGTSVTCTSTGDTPVVTSGATGATPTPVCILQ
jgi:prepilin-type N-terminal cleavage/methylation domain-containing protein